MPRTRRRRLIAIILALIGIYLGINVAAAWSFLHPPREVAAPIEGTDTFKFPGPGGAVPAYLSINFHSARLIFICAHGYLGNRDAFDGIAQGLIQMGYGVMIPCMPGQDASPASTVSFGPEEAVTVVNCIDYVRTQNPTAHIVLLGISLGGSACWMAAAERTRHVDAVITEGAFANLSAAVTGALNDKVPFGAVILRPCVWIAELFSGLRVAQVNPVEEAAKWKGPGLVIQAGDDHLIGRDQADKLSQAAHVPEWIVPGSKHAHCYQTNPKGYLDQLHQLALKALKG